MSKNMKWDRTRKGPSPSAFSTGFSKSTYREIRDARVRAARVFRDTPAWKRELHAHEQSGRRGKISLPKIDLPE